MIRSKGAAAWVTPSVQVRQAYFGRPVTITRSWAGTMSSRSLRTSSILCRMPQPQGHIKLSGSMTSSMRGSAAGRLLMVHYRAGLFVDSPALAGWVPTPFDNPVQTANDPFGW